MTLMNYCSFSRLISIASFFMMLCNSSSFLFAQDIQKRFSVLGVEETNISFDNRLEDTKDHNIMIYSNYYGGAGVGIGDFNNDNLPDLFFAGNLVSDELYINQGNLKFENVSESAGIKNNGGWSSGVIVADVNQDGWEDIYVTRELYDSKAELRKNKLYINTTANSKGKKITFSEESAAYGVDNSERTRHATFLDYDNDGDLDLFLLNQPPNPGDYSEYYDTDLLKAEWSPKLYSYHNGKFHDVTEAAGFHKTGFPNSVTASDLNNDGWTDLFVANDFYAGDWYYINNGDGTFTDKIEDYARHTSFSSMGVDAADINNDGKLDIGVVDMVAEDNYRQKANMSGMNPAAFWKVVDDGGHHQYMFNMLHLNTGEGQLSDIAQMAGVASTDWSWSILMADLDNDGWKDIFITNGLMRDIRNKDASKVFPQYLESALHKYVQENPNPVDIGIWDIVDINKALDLIPSEKLSNYVFKNNGDLTFTKQVENWGFEEQFFSNGAAYSDLDNDGDLDLIVNNINDPVTIYKNNSSDNFENNYLRVKLIPDDKNRIIEGSKIWITADGEQQYFEITGVRGMYSTSEKIAHFGLGASIIVDEVKIRWPDGKEQILKDIDSNQTLNIKQSKKATTIISSTSPTPLFENITEKIGLAFAHVENKFDDYKIQVLLPHKMSSFGPCLAKGDVNGDQLEDLFVGGSATYPASILIQNNSGGFDLTPNDLFFKDKIHEDQGAVFFDADQDQDLDLYVVSGGNEFIKGAKGYSDRLYLNDGKGNFSKAENNLPDLKFSGSKVRPADIDQDGDIDLFIAGRHVPWAYPEPASSVLLINENGVFTAADNEQQNLFSDLGMVNDAKWFDYNGDGWLDLAVVGEWMNILLFENRNGKLILSESNLNETTAGWWFSLETADMDGDGDQDLVAGNLGLNYKYKASWKEPFEVYYYDFDDNKKKDIVLTYYNFGIQYPLRGKQCSSEQVPLLNKQFKSFDIFANSDVATVYGDDKLAAALHYEAITFASVYFENMGNGNFLTRELPNLAQLSSINDILLEDFNGDEHLDIFLAGNLYNSEVETTRNDAGYGLLLTGDGDGNFFPLNREESGIFLPYDVKSLELITNDEERLIIVGSNDEKLQVLKANK